MSLSSLYKKFPEQEKFINNLIYNNESDSDSTDSEYYKSKSKPKSKPKEKVFDLSENGKKIKLLIDNEFFKEDAKCYTTWFPMICAIYNSVENKDEGLKLAHLFSQLNCYDEAGVDKIWNKIENTKSSGKPKSMGSIIYLAKKENLEKYNELFKYKKEKSKKSNEEKNEYNEEINEDDDISFIKTEYDIAVLVNNLYPNKIITTNQKDKQIYWLNDETILWDKEGANKVRNILSTDIYNFISKKMKDLHEEMLKQSEEEKELFSKKIKRICSLGEKLKKTNDKNNILREIMEITYNPEFSKNINKQLNSLPLKNCKVFNMINNSIEDRTSNDFFDFECDCTYLEDFDESYVRKYFLDLFCGKEDLVQVVLNILKSSLIGKPLRYIYFFTGSGSNGKSLLIKLLSNIFKSCVDIISKNVILKSKSNSHLSTEFEKLDKCRIGYTTELSDKDELNETTIKQITGDGIVNVRGICKTDETLKISTNLFVLTNKLPKFDVEPAICNRLIVVPFNNTFQINENFQDELFSYKDEIFSYIMKYGKICDKFDLTDEMKVAKENYIEDNQIDNLKDFIDSNCITLKDKKIKRNDFIKRYNDWLFSNHKPKDDSTSTKFTRNMMQKYNIQSKKSNNIVYYIDLDWKVEDELDEE